VKLTMTGHALQWETHWGGVTHWGGMVGWPTGVRWI